MLSTKDLVFKKRLVSKLVDQCVGPYIINVVCYGSKPQRVKQ